MPLLPFVIVLLSTFMHAGWNLLARQQHGHDITLPLLLIISVVGLLPAILIEWQTGSILPTIWSCPLVACFQAMYYFGLFKGYHQGEFTVVYPLARSLPVLALTLADVIQGDVPTVMG